MYKSKGMGFASEEQGAEDIVKGKKYGLNE
jgi:hypothetical protein